MQDYKDKYLIYKSKYLELKNIIDSKIVQDGGKKLKYKSTNNYKHLSRMEEIKPDHIENLSEPWFTLISLGLKTVEGRKNKGRFKEMKIGDIVQWTNNDFAPRTVLTEIIGKAEYKTFGEYLEAEGLDKCLPEIKDLDTGLSVYYKYFTKEDEKEFGVIAIRIKLI